MNRRRTADAATTPPRVLHRVDVVRPHEHHLRVASTFEGFGGDETTLVLPVWTPGSYMVRDFSRHLFDVAAKDDRGRKLPIRKTRKNAWVVRNRGRGFVVSFRAFAMDPTVRTAYLDAERGWFNGANVFLFVEGRTDVGATVDLRLPRGFKLDTTLKPEAKSKTRFVAKDYDALCDHPFVFGADLKSTRFVARRVPHRFTTIGAGALPYDVGEKTARIVEAAARLFGGLPYRDYAFLTAFGSDAEGMGGLEHRDCCLLQVPSRASLDPAKTRALYGLIAHEHFHAWNVKRIRDRALGPFDYEREVYTELLWLHEGFTSYYDDLLPTRAKVFDAEHYLSILGDAIAAYRGTPGRRVQSLAEASFDAWIKFYKKNEETRSTTVSYYSHGALFALTTDLEIRRETGGRKSLDDVMRALWRDAKKGGVLDAERFLDLANEATGLDLRPLHNRRVLGLEELPFDDLLADVGVRLVPKNPADLEKPRLGVAHKIDGGRVVVEEALHDGPAFDAGVQARDEIVAVGGVRVGADLDHAMRGLRPGDKIPVDVFRGDRLLRFDVKVGRAPSSPLLAEGSPSASAAARRRFRAWCGAVHPAAARGSRKRA
jgi:predicted metalloprotease with PDZ domain